LILVRTRFPFKSAVSSSYRLFAVFNLFINSLLSKSKCLTESISARSSYASYFFYKVIRLSSTMASELF
jgi:hypothetical protein